MLDDILTMHDRYEAFMLLAKYYLAAPDTEREHIRGQWDFGVEWNYPDQSRLACQTGEKYSCEERIIASLVCDSLENLKGDFRETLVALCIIYHSCIFAGLDPAEIFQRVAKVSSTKVGQALREFVDRVPSDRSLEAFFLKAYKISEGEWEIKEGTGGRPLTLDSRNSFR